MKEQQKQDKGQTSACLAPRALALTGEENATEIILNVLRCSSVNAWCVNKESLFLGGFLGQFESESLSPVAGVESSMPAKKRGLLSVPGCLMALCVLTLGPIFLCVLI